MYTVFDIDKGELFSYNDKVYVRVHITNLECMEISGVSIEDGSVLFLDEVDNNAVEVVYSSFSDNMITIFPK